jgi:hypothetical protein
MKLSTLEKLKSNLISRVIETLVEYEVKLDDLEKDSQLLDSFTTLVLNGVDLHKEVELSYIEHVNKVPVEEVITARTYAKNGRVFSVIDGGKNINSNS